MFYEKRIRNSDLLKYLLPVLAEIFRLAFKKLPLLTGLFLPISV